ncbi:hypothetical protein BGZ51_004359 [Haplosporangium sp. Z 767]|nr:hypothetical protein BGZ51_004359 [Haplosporangium sp. Z 767]
MVAIAVKPFSSPKSSPAAQELDRISITASHDIAARIHGTQQGANIRVKPDAPRKSGPGSARPTSEPVSRPAVLAETQTQIHSPNGRRAATSIDYGLDAGVMEQKKERNSRQGAEIMYAVVKGVPPKPAIPKLVGASGSGTVAVPRAHKESCPRSNDRGYLITNNMDDSSNASNNGRRTTPRPDSQQTLVHSKTENTAIANGNKRKSVQSFTSMLHPDDSISDDSHAYYYDRDIQEETSLLQKDQEKVSEKAKKNRSRESSNEREQKAFKPERSIAAKSTLGGHVVSQLNGPQKYAGGTPLGTKRSESAPENSTLDSSDALFQPTAPLITYPALDAYLSSLKPAQFSEIPKSTSRASTAKSWDGSESSASLTGTRPLPPTPSDAKLSKKASPPDPRVGMFPPLGMVPVGVTLEQLKVNVTKPPGFFDQELQNAMLSAAVDGIMSGESSNIGISWMRLEIIRDFLQFVGLYLSVSGNTFVNQKWLYATVNIIPAVLSFDFPRAMGYGMVFLILLGVICFVALYTFKIMTRTDPNDDIEGLEVSSWNLRSKKARIETISIVFLLTTLYLPLAKLSFDALVWSDTMWPISNPYKTVDFPVLEPLGPSGIYRDPSDFCYVTSMKIQDLNFAYVIIPLAIFTLCANTFYFPLAIRRLVMLNLPRIDRYTEQGERRLDLDEEYKRLTNADNSPYNFLYNGYRREYGTYKAVVMFIKLVAVIIVVFFSKDNCLFRGYERRTIEATRAGLQILFTVSLIYRHYRTQPFLYASQNLSEYWSRACTVVTSVIGLFIVLKVGPLSVNTLGIMLVATYALMCVVVIWFVIRQTQKFQTMVKQIQQRLDFSLEIYNPRLNYSKHIKRRIWQETWTTTLLVEESFKMPADKVVAYSQSPHRPPYLLNFAGSVAERHVENLRIVRQIGLRAYSQACQFLTPAMIRKRALILKEFVGPDMYFAPEFMASNIKTYFGKAYVVPFPFSVVFVYDESSVVVTLVKEHDLDRYIQQNQDQEIQRRRDLRYQLRALDGKFVVRPFIETRGIQRGRESNGTLEMSLVNAPVSYRRGLFTIHRKKMSSWQGHNMNPGFSVTITYSDGEVQDPQGSSQLLHETTIGHDVIGITRDFQVTPALARLLRDNHALISRDVKKVKKVMQAYQAYYRNEALHKDTTLSYDFFINVYDNPTLKQKELEPLLLATEENPKIRHPSPQVSLAIQFLYERMRAVNRTRCHQWWFLFWDDLYRKNHVEISQLVPKEFSPAFPESICYRPMSRPDLEKFLERQGCWQKNGRAGFMHVGVLNRMYTFLNELVFEKMTKEQRQKQLEMTTVERQRLENMFLVTKAKIYSDGTYKRLPILHGDDEKQATDMEDVELGNGHDQGLSRKSSQASTGRKTNKKKGWFESITPGRRWRPAQHPSQKGTNYSPGYIIPQTWQQKASQLTALLIGGRPDDIIGGSDEEDDLGESHAAVALVQKKKRTSVGSLERRLAAEYTGPESKHDSLKAEDEYGRRQRQLTQPKDRQTSWASSMSTVSDTTVTEGAQQEELIPLNAKSRSSSSLDRTEPGLDYKRAGQIRQIGSDRRDDVHNNNNNSNNRSSSMDEDPGVASDAMSITSMSSEDYW